MSLYKESTMIPHYNVLLGQSNDIRQLHQTSYRNITLNSFQIEVLGAQLERNKLDAANQNKSEIYDWK